MLTSSREPGDRRGIPVTPNPTDRDFGGARWPRVRAGGGFRPRPGSGRDRRRVVETRGRAIARTTVGSSPRRATRRLGKDGKASVRSPWAKKQTLTKEWRRPVPRVARPLRHEGAGRAGRWTRRGPFSHEVGHSITVRPKPERSFLPCCRVFPDRRLERHVDRARLALDHRPA